MKKPLNDLKILLQKDEHFFAEGEIFNVIKESFE